MSEMIKVDWQNIKGIHVKLVQAAPYVDDDTAYLMRQAARHIEESSSILNEILTGFKLTGGPDCWIKRISEILENGSE